MTTLLASMGDDYLVLPEFTVDAHHVSGYDDIRYGIGVARKAWLTKKDVVNTLPVAKLLALFEARR